MPLDRTGHGARHRFSVNAQHAAKFEQAVGRDTGLVRAHIMPLDRTGHGARHRLSVNAQHAAKFEQAVGRDTGLVRTNSMPAR